MLDEMLLGVIVLNTAIATLCFWGAWRLVRFRTVVQQWAMSLETINTELQQMLPQISLEIQGQRQALRDRHQRYSQLQIRLRQYLKWTQQSLVFVQWGTARWRRSGNLSPRVSENSL